MVLEPAAIPPEVVNGDILPNTATAIPDRFLKYISFCYF